MLSILRYCYCVIAFDFLLLLLILYYCYRFWMVAVEIMSPLLWLRIVAHDFVFPIKALFLLILSGADE